jgi:hypothetical protein
MIGIPSYIKGVIIGLVLSDALLSFPGKRSKNALLGFGQSTKSASYFWFVFKILSHYCKSYPYKAMSRLGGVFHFGFVFQTRSLPCFTELYNLFYVNGVKGIPLDIFNLLTPPALAHWMIGDGSRKSSGLILCKHSFTASSSDEAKSRNSLSHGGSPVYIYKADTLELLLIEPSRSSAALYLNTSEFTVRRYLKFGRAFRGCLLRTSPISSYLCYYKSTINTGAIEINPHCLYSVTPSSNQPLRIAI